MDELISYIEKNMETAVAVFDEWYTEKAEEEGEEMQGNDRYYGEDGEDYDTIDLYEDFAHATGHSASYHGAYGVIYELGTQMGLEVDPEDEELQWEVLLTIDKEPV